MKKYKLIKPENKEKNLLFQLRQIQMMEIM